MKKLICIALTALVLIGAFASCTGSYDKAPDEYKNIRWINADYSFSIYPSDDCRGSLKFNEKTYSIKVEFDTSTLTAFDTSNKDAELFTADWMYDDDDLYIYNVMYNTAEYKELDENYNEFFTLAKEKTK